MKQVVQPLSRGPVRVLEVPRPTIGPTEVLVRTVASVISPGTERALITLAQSNLISKARSRPDLVRQLARKARTEGLAATARKARARLDSDLPLGYSAAGIVLETGDHVTGVSPGQLVATAGAGSANHAEYQAVAGLLCVPVREGVPAEEAAFAAIASIALHGLRLADLQPGSKVVVIGLGLVGQLAVRLAQASGMDVAGIDIADFPLQRARSSGVLALVEHGEPTTAQVMAWTRGQGADAVLLAASGSSSDAVMRAPEICRDRGTVVVIGDVGLDLQRTPFYDKELSIRFARSYGPGRYERSYEEWGVDYPAGYVRWTEGRNLEAVLDLLASGRLGLGDLVTHRFPIEKADRAYAMISARAEPYLGVALTYSTGSPSEGPVRLRASGVSAGSGVGLIGAGAFASGVLVPALRAAGFGRFVSVASRSGLTARRLAERAGFEKVVSGGGAVIDDPDVDIVVIATPHDGHATLAAQALRAGKHVYCEKPLALTMEELDDVEAAWRQTDAVLFVGFNRRFTPALELLCEHLAGGPGPLVVVYRVNAGTAAPDHWYSDRRQGGRVLGEVCHFVDACSAVVGEPAHEARIISSMVDRSIANGNAVVSLRYPSGSLAMIAYCTGGHETTEKERIEVHGRGHSAVLSDFRNLSVDGREVWRGRQDKGHDQTAAAFRHTIVSNSRPTWPLSSSRALLSGTTSWTPTYEHEAEIDRVRWEA
jgi:predicted dehydrogenase/threonine dehydrogenase-like Zn-dependent dehydrogenase